MNAFIDVLSALKIPYIVESFTPYVAVDIELPQRKTEVLRFLFNESDGSYLNHRITKVKT